MKLNVSPNVKIFLVFILSPILLPLAVILLIPTIIVYLWWQLCSEIVTGKSSEFGNDGGY
jgi:hypothetical protein